MKIEIQPFFNPEVKKEQGSKFFNLGKSLENIISKISSSLLEKPVAPPEDRSKNPLYKALPPLQDTVKRLLDLEPKTREFISVPFRESLAANWIPTEDNFFEDQGVQLAEKAFESFCNKEPGVSLIPPIVHFIWMGSEPPKTVELAMASWKKHNPSFEVKLWTDAEIQKFSWSCPHSEMFFKTAKNWAEKSDILRFEILYQLGGIYCDTDAVCLNSFENLLNRGMSFFAGFESNKIKRFGRPLIGSALIGAAPRSSVIKRCIDFSQTMEEAPAIHQHIRSGPGPITKASYEALESGEKNVLLLPCSYLYPLPWEKRLASVEEIINNILPETFAIHLWEGSWFDSYHPPK